MNLHFSFLGLPLSVQKNFCSIISLNCVPTTSFISWLCCLLWSNLVTWTNLIPQLGLLQALSIQPPPACEWIWRVRRGSSKDINHLCCDSMKCFHRSMWSLLCLLPILPGPRCYRAMIPLDPEGSKWYCTRWKFKHYSPFPIQVTTVTLYGYNKIAKPAAQSLPGCSWWGNLGGATKKFKSPRSRV